MRDEHRDQSHTTALPTFFAPAERADPSVLEEEIQHVSNSELFNALLEAADGFIVILNEQRQILAANKRLFETFGITDSCSIFGKRPGEFFHCVHRCEGPGGCGTSKFCSTCGAAISIVEALETNTSVVRECLLTTEAENGTSSTEFRVRSTPITVGPYRFVVVVFTNISGEKRKEALERTFFHDLANTLSGLYGWSQFLANLEGQDPRTAAKHILSLSERIVRDVNDHRVLLLAENGQLQVQFSEVKVETVLGQLEHFFEHGDVLGHGVLDVEYPGKRRTLTTEKGLLFRVLVNMIKNALEACRNGETVTVSCDLLETKVRFNVHNPSFIPDEIAQRIFQRCFSTKEGPGHGIGTYSMKLLGEQFLGGKVGFKTSEKDGTTFWIELPEKG